MRHPYNIHTHISIPFWIICWGKISEYVLAPHFTMRFIPHSVSPRWLDMDPPIRMQTQLYHWLKTCMGFFFLTKWGESVRSGSLSRRKRIKGRKRLKETVVGTPIKSSATTTWPGFVILKMAPSILLAYPGFAHVACRRLRLVVA